MLGGHEGSQPQGTTSSKSERGGKKMFSLCSMFLMRAAGAGGQSWMLTKGGCSGKAHPPRLLLSMAKSHFCSKFSLDDSAGCYQEQRS